MEPTAAPPTASPTHDTGLAIHFDHVSRSYDTVLAVDDVTFEVRPGEVVGLLGPNGAGKTTLLRLLATLLKPDSGQVRVGPYCTQANPLQVRSQIGYQTGDTGLYNRLKPVEFLRYFGRLNGMPAARLESRIEYLIDKFGIRAYVKQLCGQLSTGQKQRVTLARTMLTDPPVLVLDEPTSGLDIVSSQFILKALVKAARAGQAVLFSTHIMSEVELICDRVVVIHKGRIVTTGTVAEILEQTGTTQLSRAFLGLIGEELEPDSAAADAP